MKTVLEELEDDILKLMENKCYINPSNFARDVIDLINYYKEKEKQQIIDSVNSHDKECIITINNVICKLKPSCKMLFEYDGKAGVEYFNNTYKTVSK